MRKQRIALPPARLLTGTLIVIPWLRARWIISAVSKIISGLTISSGNEFGAFGGSVGITVSRINLSGPTGLTIAGRTNGPCGSRLSSGTSLPISAGLEPSGFSTS
jgi:hypothetical protein